MRIRPLTLLIACLAAAAPSASRGASPSTAPTTRPLMADFIGLNVHTVQFKPGLYKPVCRLVRDYHPMNWDVGGDTAHQTTFPMAVNRVDWSALYGNWTKAGYEVDACIMFNSLPPGKWKDTPRDARAYGEAFARYFGPSGKHPWVTSAEIGNEPAEYTADQYRTVFEAMARGLRAGDPKLKVVTAAVMTGTPDKWSKPVAAIDGLTDLYDVLNVHSYAFKDKWPTWRRSYPEDPSIGWLKSVQDLIDWRDAHAPGKAVWLTEFGYDSSSKPADKSGEWSKWVGVTDEQQAQWIARSFLVLSATDVDRAYLYFFNDQDEPKLHAASGITRNFKPKPSFHAMGHLYATLGGCRFMRAVAKGDDLYCFEYAAAAPSRERVYVAWLPTGSGKTATKVLPLGDAAAGIYKAERLRMSTDGPAAVKWKAVPGGIELEVTETPVFVFTR